MSKVSEPEMKDVVKDILENINRARKKFEKKTSNTDITNKCADDESGDAAYKPVCGAQNCRTRDTPAPPCPAAATQCKKNVSYNTCFYVQNSV